MRLEALLDKVGSRPNRRLGPAEGEQLQELYAKTAADLNRVTHGAVAPELRQYLVAPSSGAVPVPISSTRIREHSVAVSSIDFRFNVSEKVEGRRRLIARRRYRRARDRRPATRRVLRRQELQIARRALRGQRF